MKINIAVLFGGKSVEHEVSIISALQAIRAINKDKYEVYPVYITKRNELYYSEELTDIQNYKDIPALLKRCRRVTFTVDGNKTTLSLLEKKLFEKPEIAVIDVAFPIVHGTNVEDGSLQGYLHTLNLPFVGCEVLSSAVCMDKYVSKMLLKEAGIPVLDCVRLTRRDYVDSEKAMAQIKAKFPYPVIIKPVNLGSSVGIAKADNDAELEEALDDAFSYADVIIAEPAIVRIKEINCSVIGDSDEAVPSECEEPVMTDGILSYKDKYMSSDGKAGSKADGAKTSGGTKGEGGMASLKRKIPADISDELKNKIQRAAVDAFGVLGCNGVVRIDFIVDYGTNEFWLNEINTIPGSLSFYLWEPVGVKYSELIEKMITLALKRQRLQEDITYSFDTNILANFTGGAKGAKGSKM